MRLLLLLIFVSSTANAADAEKGKAAFVRHGCFQCHGFVGQGGSAAITSIRES